MGCVLGDQTRLGEKLVALRASRGISQTELAKKARIKASTISRIETSGRTPYRTTLLKIAKALDLSVELLLDPHIDIDELNELSEKSKDKGPTRVPVISWSSAGKGRDWTDQGMPAGKADEWIERPSNIRDPHSYAVRVSGDSMSPGILDGDVLVIDHLKEPVPGDLVLVRTQKHEVMVKVLKRQAGRIVLLSANPAYEPIVLEESDLVMPPRKVAAILKR